MRLLCHTLEIMDALADGPKFAHELPGPWHLISNRVRDCNTAYRKIGSGWRIRGRWVHVPCRGVRMRAILYSLRRE